MCYAFGARCRRVCIEAAFYSEARSWTRRKVLWMPPRLPGRSGRAVSRWRLADDLTARARQCARSSPRKIKGKNALGNRAENHRVTGLFLRGSLPYPPLAPRARSLADSTVPRCTDARGRNLYVLRDVSTRHLLDTHTDAWSRTMPREREPHTGAYPGSTLHCLGGISAIDSIFRSPFSFFKAYNVQ